MKSMPCFLPALFLLFVGLGWPAAVFAGGDEWRPVDPAELALKTPVVEKDADAETIFWDVFVDDSAGGGLVFHQYVRIKVFNDRGRDRESRVDIPYADNSSIEGIVARTIRTDGSTVELRQQDIFDRTIVKLSGAAVKAKSFVLPGVEPGAILEYRWREVRRGKIAYYIRLPFQRDIPVREVTYHFRPNLRIGAPMRLAYFHMPPTELFREGNFLYRSSMTDVPAFREEPHMPPEYQVRPWMLVYYVRKGTSMGDKYWEDLGRKVYEGLRPMLKANDEVRRAAQEAIGDAVSPDEKLQRLFDFCHSRVKNIYDSASEMTAEERASRKENKTPADILKHGQGTGFEINALFAALANAAGFDARGALLADRSDAFFDRTFPDPYFLRTISIAVKFSSDWRFFDPGSTYVPYGMLPWQEEGEAALITDPGTPLFVITPVTAPEKSRQMQTAKLRLTEDGALEGDVRVEYTGHLAVEMKKRNDDDSPAQREQNLRNAIKERLPAAEVSDVHIENVIDTVKPFICTYHLRVRQYADLTGKRIFLQPAFFQYGLRSVFSSADRTNDISFNYPWSERDEVTIELPKGYSLEHLDPMSPVSMGSSDYDAGIYLKEGAHLITYKRNFVFGRDGRLLFPASWYPRLKEYFDAVRHRDAYKLALTQTTATAISN